MQNAYGANLKLHIYGGSHDEMIGMRLYGIPAGYKIDPTELYAFLSRRAPGHDAYSTSRRESDRPVFISGLDGDTTNGDVIEAVIYNQDQNSAHYATNTDIPRPSHADFAAIMKYGESVDLRGGGHFSGRLTAPMCVAGGICLQILKTMGIRIGAHIASVADVCDKPYNAVSITDSELYAASNADFPTLDATCGEQMKAKINEARLCGDSVGGVVECAVIGAPAGLGEHMFMGVEGRISAAVFAIPAVKGVEFGLGFGSSRLYGSQNNDAFSTDGERITTKTNNAGGILGGMTNGMPIIFRAAIKPTPSIAKEQDSVSLSRMENVKLSIVGRHDPCIVPRAVAVLEAAAAIAVYDMMLDQALEGLSGLRQKINHCDNGIVALFKERMGISAAVAQYKRENGLPVLDAEREKALLDKIEKSATDELAVYARRLYETMLSVSRDYQTSLIDTPAKIKCGLIGKSLSHSFSPIIHQKLASYDYELFELEENELGGFVKDPASFDACNVTIPYKKTIIPYLDEISEDAKKIGSVNTVIRRKDGSLFGDNTDYFGFCYMLNQGNIDVCDKNVVILGMGGASATAQAVCSDLGAKKITLISRAGEVNYENVYDKAQDAEIIINCTPVGMYPDNEIAPVELAHFTKLIAVADMIYNPAKTKLLLDAESLGIKHVNGLSMLAAQAKRSCEMFLSRSISDTVIDRITREIEAETKNIVLIGMPSCGKTTVAKLLAEKLKRPMLDTDQMIENAEQSSIPDILTSLGEDYFRALERRAAIEAGKLSGYVLATGGGIVKTPENYVSLRQNSTVVFINRDTSLLSREGRPLSQNADLEKMLEERLPLYRHFCDLEVLNNTTPEQCANDIIKALGGDPE